MALQVRQLATNVAFTSAAAVLTASLINSLKGKPLRRNLLFKRTLIISGVGLTTGLTAGCIFKFYRKQPSIIVYTSTITGALSGAVTGGVFLSLREILTQENFTDLFPKREKSREYFISATSGGVTGSVVTLFARLHIVQVFTTGAVGFVFGAASHVVYDIIMKWRHNFLIRQKYPEHAEEIIRQSQYSEYSDQQHNDDNSGYLLRPYRKFRVVLSDIDDRIMGRTGCSAIKKLMVERKIQLQLLEDEEEKLRAQLEMTEPAPQVIYENNLVES